MVEVEIRIYPTQTITLQHVLYFIKSAYCHYSAPQVLRQVRTSLSLTVAVHTLHWTAKN